MKSGGESFHDGQISAQLKININYYVEQYESKATLRFLQTFVKFIFNEGNKMINVSEMKISLRKSPFVSISEQRRKRERKENEAHEGI